MLDTRERGKITAPERTQRFFERQTALLTMVEQMRGRQMEFAEAMIARLALPPPVAMGPEIQISRDTTGTQPTFYLG